LNFTWERNRHKPTGNASDNLPYHELALQPHQFLFFTVGKQSITEQVMSHSTSRMAVFMTDVSPWLAATCPASHLSTLRRHASALLHFRSAAQLLQWHPGAADQVSLGVS
jgi:hypothetical protein